MKPTPGLLKIDVTLANNPTHLDVSNVTETFRGINIHSTGAGAGAGACVDTSTSDVHLRPVASINENVSYHVYDSNYYQESPAQETDQPIELQSKRTIELNRMIRCALI